MSYIIFAFLLISKSITYYQIVNCANFIYEPKTKAVGREAAVLSLLGPLFALSVSADDGKVHFSLCYVLSSCYVSVEILVFC